MSSRLVDYFVVVSYDSPLQVLDRSDDIGRLSSGGGGGGGGSGGCILMQSGDTNDALATTAAAAAMVGGAGGVRDPEPSSNRSDSDNGSGLGKSNSCNNTQSPSNSMVASFMPTTLSPIAGSPVGAQAGSSSAATGASPDSSMSEPATTPAVSVEVESSVALTRSQCHNHDPSPTPLSPASSVGLSTLSPPVTSTNSTPASTNRRHRHDGSNVDADNPAQLSPLYVASEPLPTATSLPPISEQGHPAIPTSASSEPSLPSSAGSSDSSDAASASPPDIDPLPSAPPILGETTSAVNASSNVNGTGIEVGISSVHGNGKPMSVPLTPRSLQSFTHRIYAADVVDRFPSVDHRSVPFPPGIPMFCLPDDISLSIVPDAPTLYYFACTGGSGVRLYGTCLKFAEPLPEELAAEVWEEETRVQENKRRMKEVMRKLNVDDEQCEVNTDSAHPPTAAPSTGASPSRSDSAEESAPRATSSASISAASSTSSSSTSASVVPSSSLSAAPFTAPFASQSVASDDELYAYCQLPFKQRPTIYAPKCLCLLSTYPFLKQYRAVLTGLYRLSLSQSSIPLERIVCNFMCEVPLPPLGEVQVQYALQDQIITFARPPPNNPFSLHHFPVRLLFNCLDFAHATLLIECMLAEKRILLLSTKLSSLTIIAETMLALMFPFQWQHVYIPLLPKALVDFLHAPMPFIIGMHPSYLRNHPLRGDMCDDLVIVDLDRNHIELAGSHAHRPPALPQKEKKKLWRKFKQLPLFGATSRTPYEQSLFDNMDLAFNNAPLPVDVEAASANIKETSLDHLVSMEMSANQNHSPPSAAARAAYHARKLSKAGSTSRLQRGMGKSGGSSRALTSPSALSRGMRANSYSHPPKSITAADDDDDDDDYPVPTSLIDGSDDSIDYLISSAFFRVFVSLFKDYRPFLIFPSPSHPFPDPCFDLDGFLKVQEKNGGSDTGISIFMIHFVSTQAFRRFCEERIYPSTQSRDQKRVLFFDESIIAKRNRNRFTKRMETPFLKDRSTDIRRTFVAPSPDTSNLPTHAKYAYPVFPRLDPKLFVKPRLRTPILVQTQQQGISIGLGSWSTKRTRGRSNSDTGSVSSLTNSIMSSVMNKEGPRRLSFPPATNEQVVSTIWFLLFSSIAGEVGPSAAGQLDLAFRLLINQRHNGIQVEEEVFPCLQLACGRCAVPERAIDVLREMQNAGYEPNPNTYAALLQVFTMNYRGHEALADIKLGRTTSPRAATSPTTAASFVASIKEKLQQHTRGRSVSIPASTQSKNNTVAPTSDMTEPPASSLTTYYHAASDPLSPLSPQPLKFTEIRPEDRINMYKLQFEMMFPTLEIDTKEECPECAKSVFDHEIRAGWTTNPNDYTTRCPQCGERFVARFSVRVKTNHVASSSTQPTQPTQVSADSHTTQDESLLSPDSLALLKATRTLAGTTMAASSIHHSHTADTWQEDTVRVNTAFCPAHSSNTLIATPSASSDSVPATNPSSPPAPLWCEYLSPRVLKKELLRLLSVKPARYLCTRSFRRGEKSSVLFWNLMWHLTNHAFPIDFLIRGNNHKQQAAASSTATTKQSNETSTVESEAHGMHSRSHPSNSVRSSTRNNNKRAAQPIDAFQRSVLASRASGIGRNFGYGSGGIVAGAGAVGMSLAGVMQRQEANSEQMQQTIHHFLTHSYSYSQHQLPSDDELDDAELSTFDDEDDAVHEQFTCTHPSSPLPSNSLSAHQHSTSGQMHWHEATPISSPSTHNSHSHSHTPMRPPDLGVVGTSSS